MNQAEIIEALNAVRSAGHEFTKSFNHLSDIIEAMAAENESLHVQVAEKERIIGTKDEALGKAKATQESASARATKAEKDAWDMAQSLAKTKNRVQELESFNDGLNAAMTNAERELADLRPMRQQRDIAFADLTTANSTIASLRQEVSKLLEIILNVATSVDGVVNKPKTDVPECRQSSDMEPYQESRKPKTNGPTDFDDFGYPRSATSEVSSEPLMNPDTGESIPNRHYPRSAA